MALEFKDQMADVGLTDEEQRKQKALDEASSQGPGLAGLDAVLNGQPQGTNLIDPVATNFDGTLKEKLSIPERLADSLRIAGDPSPTNADRLADLVSSRVSYSPSPAPSGIDQVADRAAGNPVVAPAPVANTQNTNTNQPPPSTVNPQSTVASPQPAAPQEPDRYAALRGVDGMDDTFSGLNKLLGDFDMAKRFGVSGAEARDLALKEQALNVLADRYSRGQIGEVGLRAAVDALSSTNRLQYSSTNGVDGSNIAMALGLPDRTAESRSGGGDPYRVFQGFEQSGKQSLNDYLEGIKTAADVEYKKSLTDRMNKGESAPAAEEPVADPYVAFAAQYGLDYTPGDKVVQKVIDEMRLEDTRQRALSGRTGAPSGGNSLAALASSKAAPTPAPQAPAPRSPQDVAAVQWAQANPNDPRAAAILKRNGM